MVEHPPRIDEVESGVREGKRLGVRGENFGIEPFQLKPPPDKTGGCFCQVDSGRLGARAGEVNEVRSEPDPDLQHPLAAPALELGEGRNEGLQPVTLCLDLIEELA